MDQHFLHADELRSRQVFAEKVNNLQDKVNTDSRVLQLAIKKGVVRSEALKKKQSDLLKSPHYGRLVNESHCVFSRLQKAVSAFARNDDPEFLKSLDQASREYRAVLRSAIVAVHRSALESDRKLLLCLRGREMLWGLVELVAFSERDEELGAHLAKWARMMLVSEATDVYVKIFDLKCGKADENGLYWNGVILQVLSCNFATATTMLHSYTGAQSDRAVGKMAIVLERLNRLFTDGFSASEFVDLQQSVQLLISEDYFSDNGNVMFIARLLCGDTEAYKEVCCELIDYWCEVVPLFTITQMPNATLSNLHDYAKKCFNFKEKTGSRQLDLTIMSALSGDLMEALLGAANCFGDWWLSAHLSDLIYRVNPVLLFEDSANLRDVFLLEHADNLFSDNQLWRAGVDYVTGITNGFELLEDYILMQPFDSTKKGLQLLSICTKWDLKVAQESVTRKLAERSMANSEHVNSLLWSIRNGDSLLISSVVSNILRQTSSDDILTIGSYLKFKRELAYSCPELAFFTTYFEVLRFVDEKKSGEAIGKLTFLLQSKLVPPFMYSSLLSNMLELLEDAEIQVGDVVQGIMQCLHKLRLEIGRSNQRIEQKTKVNEQIALLNSILTGHLLQRDLLAYRN